MERKMVKIQGLFTSSISTSIISLRMIFKINIIIKINNTNIYVKNRKF